MADGKMVKSWYGENKALPPESNSIDPSAILLSFVHQQSRISNSLNSRLWRIIGDFFHLQVPRLFQIDGDDLATVINASVPGLHTLEAGDNRPRVAGYILPGELGSALFRGDAHSDKQKDYQTLSSQAYKYNLNAVYFSFKTSDLQIMLK